MSSSGVASVQSRWRHIFLKFSLLPRSEQVSGAHANEIKHDHSCSESGVHANEIKHEHSPEVIVV